MNTTSSLASPSRSSRPASSPVPPSAWRVWPAHSHHHPDRLAHRDRGHSGHVREAGAHAMPGWRFHNGHGHAYLGQ